MTQPYNRLSRPEVEALLRQSDIDPAQYASYSFPALKGLLEGVSLGHVQADAQWEEGLAAEAKAPREYEPRVTPGGPYTFGQVVRNNWRATIKALRG